MKKLLIKKDFIYLFNTKYISIVLLLCGITIYFFFVILTLEFNKTCSELGNVRITDTNYIFYNLDYGIIKPLISFNIILGILLFSFLSINLLLHDVKSEFTSYFTIYKINPREYIFSKYIVIGIVIFFFIILGLILPFLWINTVSKSTPNIFYFLFSTIMSYFLFFTISNLSFYISMRFKSFFKTLIAFYFVLFFLWLIYLPHKIGLIYTIFRHISISYHIQNILDFKFYFSDLCYFLIFNIILYFLEINHFKKEKL